MTSALIASDYYLIPVKPDPISLTGIDLLKSIIEERRDNFNLHIQCAGLVLTLTEANTVVLKNARSYLGRDAYWREHLFNSSLPKRTEIARNQLNQIPILLSGNSSAKTSIAGITEEFLTRIEANADENQEEA